MQESTPRPVPLVCNRLARCRIDQPTRRLKERKNVMDDVRRGLARNALLSWGHRRKLHPVPPQRAGRFVCRRIGASCLVLRAEIPNELFEVANADGFEYDSRIRKYVVDVC